MLKRLLKYYHYLIWSLSLNGIYGVNRAAIIVCVIKDSYFVRKGQEQMMADYMLLELVESGEI